MKSKGVGNVGISEGELLKELFLKSCIELLEIT